MKSAEGRSPVSLRERFEARTLHSCGFLLALAALVGFSCEMKHGIQEPTPTAANNPVTLDPAIPPAEADSLEIITADGTFRPNDPQPAGNPSAIPVFVAARNEKGVLRYIGYRAPGSSLSLGPRSTAVALPYLILASLGLPQELRIAFLDRIERHPRISELASLLGARATADLDTVPFSAGYRDVYQVMAEILEDVALSSGPADTGQPGMRQSAIELFGWCDPWDDRLVCTKDDCLDGEIYSIGHDFTYCLDASQTDFIRLENPKAVYFAAEVTDSAGSTSSAVLVDCKGGLVESFIGGNPVTEIRAAPCDSVRLHKFTLDFAKLFDISKGPGLATIANFAKGLSLILSIIVEIKADNWLAKALSPVKNIVDGAKKVVDQPWFPAFQTVLVVVEAACNEVRFDEDGEMFGAVADLLHIVNSGLSTFQDAKPSSSLTDEVKKMIRVRWAKWMKHGDLLNLAKEVIRESVSVVMKDAPDVMRDTLDAMKDKPLAGTSGPACLASLGAGNADAILATCGAMLSEFAPLVDALIGVLAQSAAKDLLTSAAVALVEAATGLKVASVAITAIDKMAPFAWDLVDASTNDIEFRVHSASGCCEPDCSAVQCGMDPVCGLDCGRKCEKGMVCVARTCEPALVNCRELVDWVMDRVPPLFALDSWSLLWAAAQRTDPETIAHAQPVGECLAKKCGNVLYPAECARNAILPGGACHPEYLECLCEDNVCDTALGEDAGNCPGDCACLPDCPIPCWDGTQCSEGATCDGMVCQPCDAVSEDAHECQAAETDDACCTDDHGGYVVYSLDDKGNAIAVFFACGPGTCCSQVSPTRVECR